MNFPHFQKKRLEAIKAGKTKAVLHAKGAEFQVLIGNAFSALKALAKDGHRVTWEFTA